MHSVTSLDFFYDTVNTESYTVIKYFTTWCSHCKRLGPVFHQLSELFDNSQGTNVTFLEVNCDLFGSTLCDRLPGYPMVEVIKPLISQEVNGSTITETAPVKLSWWSKLVKTIKHGGYNPAWHMDLSRVVEFEGSRDLPILKGFIDKVIENNELDRELETILSDRSCVDKRCEASREYLSQVHQVEKEIQKLENILRSNPEEELEETKFRLKLLAKKHDSEKLERDEL